MLTLLHASYREIAFGDDRYVPEADRVAWLAELAAGELREARRHVPDVADAESYLCSTVLNATSMDAWYSRPVLTQEIGRLVDCPPPSGVLAYECASWAFILRRLQASKRPGRILVQIADMDSKGFSFWGTNRIWGASGFGLSTLVFDYVPQDEPCVWTNAAETRNPVMDFARSVKFLAAGFPRDRVSLPYFPAVQFQSIERICSGMDLAPNRHADYGHCFGSDPWIGLIEGCRADPARRNRTWICASYALNGYFGMARVRVHPQAELRLTHHAATGSGSVTELAHAQS